MLKLKFQYFGHLVQTADSLEKTLMPGKIEGIKRGCQRMRWLDSITKSIWQAPGDGEGQGGLACCSLWGHKELDMTCWPNNSNMDENTVIGTWESTWEFPLPQWKKKYENRYIEEDKNSFSLCLLHPSQYLLNTTKNVHTGHLIRLWQD